ncbi:hypothetical protein F511_10104 [Dorcoceras hygrometricum]|uniref:Aminotransferase-like plant mobile domain-containing protein n=1 Tax=Dorcoceras hygrometricum TaxID=472368 RepID=A0A2Z7AC48_9LAMI|nr:hypothetical protein F511_10104 [Dorcoceras hygrometricum]
MVPQFTNTFVFPWGEATVTLEDVMVLGGFSVVGASNLTAIGDDRDLRRAERILKDGMRNISKTSLKRASQSAWIVKFMNTGKRSSINLKDQSFKGLLGGIRVYTHGSASTSPGLDPGKILHITILLNDTLQQFALCLPMLDFELDPPSFSLGLDLDVESEPPPTQPAEQPPSPTGGGLWTLEIDEDEDFESPVRLSLQQASNPPRVLKRLRKGPAVQPKTGARNGEANDARGKCDVDDEIEGFSSEEDCPRDGHPPSHSICSSSKPSLQGRQLLTTQSWKSTKRKEVLGASTSVSPVRRFQLIDSGSDSADPSDAEELCEVGCSTSSLSKMQPNLSQHAPSGFFRKGKASVDNHETDLWKDFCKEKTFHIPTPAFDEVCDEFFRSRKSENGVVIKGVDSNNGKKWDVGFFPPAHRYFFHDDSRIQKLVRERLPNFFPLGAAKNQEHKQQAASVIDYMHQFNHEENSKRTYATSSTRTKRNVSKLNTIMPEDSVNWVTPKGCGIPKNAGKRRVRAASKSGGHWYTNSSGQRVYVSRNGQQLSGQSAYRGYRKESGIGFKKSKKKAADKEKNVLPRRNNPCPFRKICAAPTGMYQFGS